MAQSMWCSEVRNAGFFLGGGGAVKRSVDGRICNSKRRHATGGPLDPYITATVASC